jgi:hypothetical protein
MTTDSSEPTDATQTQPQLFRAGCLRRPGAIVPDPSLTVIEVVDCYGLLLAESCHEDALGQFHLTAVTWVRLEHPVFSEPLTRGFDDVLLYREASGLFVAQDAASGKLLPHPSHQPYCVVFVSNEDYQTMLAALQEPSASALTELAGQSIRNLPGFSFDGVEFTAPADYAAADLGGLAAEILGEQ